MSAQATVRAQAKVNLLLRVLARETSGYHSIETVFLRVELADTVRVRISAGTSLDLSGPELPRNGLGPTEQNLAYRAAIAYQAASGWPHGFAIEIEKNIPVGGGLGGGSADAGAVLRALDALSPNPLGAQLVEIAAPLGADVPFMTIESPMAVAWGRGERLLPIRVPDARPMLIVVPDFSVSTAAAYGWIASSRGENAPRGSTLSLAALDTWEGIAGVATNDFERVVAAHHPQITELVDELASADAMVAMMSGSGSAVFGVFEASTDVAGFVRSTGCRSFPTSTATRVASVSIES
ncbi:MAG TPA: 4-(cytidine 5'-diphospho)-2-C-methyl-D-erythritol kinase [Gemmatimonadaceae bacterium]